MSGQHPPLTCDQFKAILTKLGFVKRPATSGTTHENWVATIDGKFRKVTVDCPKAPFSQELIRSMAKQAGVTKQKIYDIHFGIEAEQQVAAVSAPTKRFEARKQDGTDFWCVWDTLMNKHAFGGQLTYMSQADATARAAEMS